MDNTIASYVCSVWKLSDVVGESRRDYFVVFLQYLLSLFSSFHN